MEWIASMQHSSSLPSLQQLKQAEVEVTVEKRFDCLRLGQNLNLP